MEELELVQKILEYIKTWYNADYVGEISVIKTDNSYNCILGIPSYMQQTFISGDFETDDEFLDYVYLELRKRNYVRKDTYRVTKTNVGIEK